MGNQLKDPAERQDGAGARRHGTAMAAADLAAGIGRMPMVGDALLELVPLLHFYVRR